VELDLKVRLACSEGMTQRQAAKHFKTVIAIGGLGIVMLIIVILLRRQIIAAVQDIRGAVEG
jgi:hypothetical protein